MHNIPLNSIESFTHVNDKNTKGQDIKVIGYTFYRRRFIYAVLINNEVALERQCKQESTTPFNLIREVLYPESHQLVLDIISTLKADLLSHEVGLYWKEDNFCEVYTSLIIKDEWEDYYWELMHKANQSIRGISGLDWHFESTGYSELNPNWNKTDEWGDDD